MDAKVQLTREKAAMLYGMISLMTGPVQFRAKREEVQAKVKKAWPEVFEVDYKAEEDAPKKRPILLNEREQKALGEGILTLVRKPEANGADFANCLDLAGTLQIKGWYKKAVTVEEVPEFEGTLDEEADISDKDEEAAPAAE